MSKLETTIAVIERAKSPRSLFPGGKAKAGEVYKRLAKIVHPDVVAEPDKTRATAAFAKLTEFYHSFIAPPKPVKVGAYTVLGAFAKGDLCDLYLTRSDLWTDEPELSALLKIARATDDNDLVSQEAETLTELHSPKFPEFYKRYMPHVLDSFKASGRQAVVLSHSADFMTLEELLIRIPKLDFRHIVWMMNRVLSMLGYIHHCGVVHGAILPEHMLFNTEHDFRLIDWCYSVQIDQKVRAIVKGQRMLYPPEVLLKRPASPSTDLYMAAASLLNAAVDVPARFKPIFDLCLAGSPSSRPADAWVFQERWKSAAHQEYGPPAFVPLTVPTH